MSLYGALFSGVSALAAQSQSMAMIADNITNVNTVGYKTTRANFSTLVTAGRSATSYAAGGVQSSPQALIDRQGLLQSSASPTDISVSGDGFFVVNTVPIPSSTTGTYLYTRAGSFTTDAAGNLRNAAGLYLQGWPIDSTGAIPANRSSLTVLNTVNVESLIGTATQTSSIAIQANLQASQALNPLVPGAPYAVGDMALPVGDANRIPADFERSIQIVDSLGGTRDITFGFLKANASNTWHVEAYVVPSTDIVGVDGLVTSGDLVFNNDGTIDTVATTVPANFGITWAAALGLANSTIALNLGTDGLADGMTQFDSSSTLVGTTINGAIFGALTGVSIDEDGIITALFDNGTRTNIYKLPIATFPNPNGLSNANGNAFLPTSDSGGLNMKEAGVGGAGQVAPSSLEASTVDLAEEFSKMIITQRAFSAGTRVITTSDEMLDELVRVVR